MSRRAFIPESLFRMESRIALSAVGHLHGPYGLSAETYGAGIFQVKNGYQLFGATGDLNQLRSKLEFYSKGIPYHRATMLGPKTNAIIDAMLVNLHTKAVPHPIKLAMHETAMGIHKDVQKLIDNNAVFVKYNA